MKNSLALALILLFHIGKLVGQFDYSQESVFYGGQISVLNEAYFELCDPFTLHSESKAQEGSMEECLVQIYLHEKWEIYQYGFSEEKKYGNFGIKRGEFKIFKDLLRFEPIYKFYYNVNDKKHCLMRYRVILPPGEGELITHMRFTHENNKWKANALPKGDDKVYYNGMMRDFRTDVLYDVLVNQQSEESSINEVLQYCKDKESGTIIFDKLYQLLLKDKAKFEKFFIQRKKGIKLFWWKKYLDESIKD